MIPDVCLGELVKVSAQKKLQIDFKEVTSELEKGKMTVGHVKERDLRHYSNLVPKVRGADRYLESTDVRILAMSMADRDCRGLLTFEGKLIENPGLLKFIAKEMTFKKNYLITDDPFKR